VSKLTRALAVAMVCLLPLSMMQAEIQGAMLYTRGMVRINGNAARVSAPIKAGDALQTSNDGTAQIVAEGTFIQVQPDSSVTYNRSSVTVQDGVATVASAKGLTGQVSSLRVSAITPTGVRYALRNQAGRVQVAALMGSVMVNGNNALAVELKAGEVYTLDTNSTTQPDPQASSNKTFFGDDAGLTFVISAAVIAGVILGVMNATSVSPAGP
jgi:hypothetical protein